MTATDTPSRVRFAEGEVATPRLRRSLGRLVYWAVIAVILVIFAIVSLVLTVPTPSTARLSATSSHTTGSAALIAVLRRDGVQVRTPRTLDAAKRDLSRSTATSTTFVIYDQASILSAAQYTGLVGSAAQVILIEPDRAALDSFAAGIDHAGVVTPTAKADCAFAPVARAGTVSGLAVGYRLPASTVAEERCLGNDGVFSLIRLGDQSHAVTVVGATTPFTNGGIVTAGNAALALGLFGQTRHLVWYLPSAADTDVVQDGVLPIPGWVPIAVALAGIVLVAAGIWRGRRFGPVVVERMPVFVRASETLEGRARLYEKSSDRLHALDSLRMGALGRMAAACGLPTVAPLDDVLGAISGITTRPLAELRQLLVESVPRTDADLVRLSDSLADLEADVARAVRAR